PRSASTTKTFQKCCSTSTGFTYCCFSMVSRMSSSSVPVPPYSESMTVFLMEQKSNSLLPSA
ncbi:30S ribosomal protein S21, partial [Dysosmobacter welbionis]